MNNSLPEKTIKIPSLENKGTEPLTQRSRFGWMPILFLVIVFCNLFINFMGLSRMKKIAQNQPYIYMQKVDGTVEKGSPVEEFWRSEAVVANFVEDWLTLAYSWNLNDPKQFVREKQSNYPLPLYVASMAIEPVYREAYLESISEKYKNRFPFQVYISGKNQSYIRVFEEPIVEEIEPGTWEVAIYAYRTHMEGNANIAHEKFNHLIRVRAVRPSNERLASEKDTFAREIMNQMQNKGLQIIQVSQY